MFLLKIYLQKNDLNTVKVIFCDAIGCSNRAYNFPAGNYMFKVNNRNTSTRCEICLKLTIKIPERRQWRLFVNFKGKFLKFRSADFWKMLFLRFFLEFQSFMGSFEETLSKKIHTTLIYACL